MTRSYEKSNITIIYNNSHPSRKDCPPRHTPCHPSGNSCLSAISTRTCQTETPCLHINQLNRNPRLEVAWVGIGQVDKASLSSVMGSRPQPAMDRYGITPAASCSVPIVKSHADSVRFRERQTYIFLTNLKANTLSQLPSHSPPSPTP